MARSQAYSLANYPSVSKPVELPFGLRQGICIEEECPLLSIHFTWLPRVTSVPNSQHPNQLLSFWTLHGQNQTACRPFHLASYTQRQACASLMLLCALVMCSFRGCVDFLMDIWAVSNWGLLWEMLLGTSLYPFLVTYVHISTEYIPRCGIVGSQDVSLLELCL